MPFNFEEFENTDEQAEDPYQDQYQEVYQEDAVLEELEQNYQPKPVSEVEKRLQLASYYQILLNDSLFTDNSPAARMVEREIREFIQQRLEVLVGLKSEGAKVSEGSVFSESEVTALKVLAAKVIGKPALLEAKKPEPVKPAIKKAAGPDSKPKLAPKANPVQVAPVAKAAPRPLQQAQQRPQPQVRQRPGNQPQRPQQRPQGQGQPRPRRAKKDMTGQVRPNDALPPPTREVVESMNQFHANNVILNPGLIETNTDPKTSVAGNVGSALMSVVLGNALQGGNGNGE